MPALLLVEDDATLRTTVAEYLRAFGFVVDAVPDGITAVTHGLTQRYDLVLLDLMLPGGTGGFEVTRRLRAAWPDLPIIMVTARGQEHERIQGLHLGADDYVTKPFSLRELALRIQCVLRRTAGPDAAHDRAPAPGLTPGPAQVTDGDLSVDRLARRVRLRGTDLSLTARELDLLLHLLTYPGVVQTRDDLLRAVWGWNPADAAGASTVTVHVRRLREKVEADPARPTRLVTVFGRGYRWDLQSPGSAGDTAAAPSTGVGAEGT